MSALAAYLAEGRTKPWQWGQHDCCAWPARWAGLDLPDYASEAEAEAMLCEAGGLVALVDRAAAGKAEEVPARDVQPGDVGVIDLVAPDLGMVEVGAIWTGQRWAFAPLAGGIAATHAECRKAWRPLCPR